MTLNEIIKELKRLYREQYRLEQNQAAIEEQINYYKNLLTNSIPKL